MTVLYLGALAAIALSLSVLMPGAWTAQHIAVRTAGISDDLRLAAFLAAFARGIPPLERQMLRSRGERYCDHQSRTSMFFPLPLQKGVAV